MKNNKIYLLGACLLCAVTVFAQNVSLQPPPQQLLVQNKTIDLPAVYQLNGGEEANPHAVKVLKELLSGKQSSKKGMLILLERKVTRVCVNIAAGFLTMKKAITCL